MLLQPKPQGGQRGGGRRRIRAGGQPLHQSENGAGSGFDNGGGGDGSGDLGMARAVAGDSQSPHAMTHHLQQRMTHGSVRRDRDDGRVHDRAAGAFRGQLAGGHRRHNLVLGH